MTETAGLPGALVDRVAELVRERTGLVLADGRRPALEQALSAALHRSGAVERELYLIRLAAEPHLLEDLVGEITVGETYFFRDPGQFELIRETILPDLLARRPAGEPLRIWSAGCASGEEAYSLAILLDQQGLSGGARILATDLSRRALERARRGRYGSWSLRGVPESVVRAYFRRHDHHFELHPAIRQAVEFRRLNLLSDPAYWPMPAADLILCRNVLIYFDPSAVQRAAEALLGALSEDGWLVAGAADPPLGELVPCRVIATEAGLVYRRPPAPALGPPAREPAATAAPVAPAPRAEGPSPPGPAADPGGARPGPGAAASAAVAAYAERDYARAAQTARRALAADPSDPALWALLVRALANRGEAAEAARAVAAALQYHGSSAELAYLEGVLLADAGRPAASAEAARRALYLDRGLVVAHLALAAALVRLGRKEEARRAFRNAERLLAALRPDEIVPASDGQPAARLAQVARAGLQSLQESA